MRKKIVGLVEKVEVIGKHKVSTLAKFDTGAKTTSIDMKLAAKAKLGPIIKTVRIISASRNQSFDSNFIFSYTSLLKILGFEFMSLDFIPKNNILNNILYTKEVILLIKPSYLTARYVVTRSRSLRVIIL